MTALVRSGAFFGAGVVLVWAWLDPSFRDPSGFAAGEAAFAISAAAALLLIAVTAGHDTERAGRWSSAALVGWSAHLQLIEAGPTVSYHHLDLWGGLGGLRSLAVVVLSLQAAALIFVGPRVLRTLRPHVERLPSKTLAVIGLLFIAGVAAIPSADPMVYASEAVATVLLQLLHLGTLVMAYLALPEEFTARVAGWITAAGPRGIPRVAWVAAAGLTLLSAILCLLVYQNHPHVPDEFVYLMPARYFADGRLALAAPPVAEAFDINLMTNDGVRWYSPVPPGWPAVLAIGAALGVPWLVNPVLGGLCVLLTGRLVSSIYDTRTGALAAILLAASPWFIFLSMSFMTHLTTVTCALIAAVMVDHSARSTSLIPSAVGGGALGWAALTRPLDALTAAIVVGTWSLWLGVKHSRPAPTVVLTLTSMVVGALTLPYNKYFTGSPTAFPLMVYTDVQYGEGTNALGFGANRGLGWPGLDPFPGHGPIDVVVNAVLNSSSINTELFGLGTGSLVLLVLLLITRSTTRPDRALLAAIGLVVFFHSFYWFSGGPDFGARYWVLTIVPLAVLSARGALAVTTRDPSDAGAGGRAGALVLLISWFALFSFVPWRALDKYHDYRGMEPGVRSLAHEQSFGRSLVLVRGEGHPDYTSAAFYNPLEWDAAAPIYAWDENEEATRAVLEHYADRPVWIVDGPSVTGNGYQLMEGPLSTEEALEGLNR